MTIYALSSGPGLSGLAVIRISGDQCMKALKEIAKISNPLPRTATLTKFYKQESNEVIDEGIIIWFPSPKSYTGEDVLEFGKKTLIKPNHIKLRGALSIITFFCNL